MYLTRLNKIILKSKKIASSFCLFICHWLLIINKKSLSVSQNLEIKFTLGFYIYTAHVIYFKLKDKYLINYFSLQANIVSKSPETSSKLLMPWYTVISMCLYVMFIYYRIKIKFYIYICRNVQKTKVITNKNNWTYDTQKNKTHEK